MKGDFKKARRELQRGLESETQKQFKQIMRLLDRKSRELKKQLNRVRRDITTKILRAARKDLAKVQAKISQLAQRVDKLEKRLKKR